MSGGQWSVQEVNALLYVWGADSVQSQLDRGVYKKRTHCCMYGEQTMSKASWKVECTRNECIVVCMGSRQCPKPAGWGSAQETNTLLYVWGADSVQNQLEWISRSRQCSSKWQVCYHTDHNWALCMTQSKWIDPASYEVDCGVRSMWSKSGSSADRLIANDVPSKFWGDNVDWRRGVWSDHHDSLLHMYSINCSWTKSHTCYNLL